MSDPIVQQLIADITSQGNDAFAAIASELERVRAAVDANNQSLRDGSIAPQEYVASLRSLMAEMSRLAKLQGELVTEGGRIAASNRAWLQSQRESAEAVRESSAAMKSAVGSANQLSSAWGAVTASARESSRAATEQINATNREAEAHRQAARDMGDHLRATSGLKDALDGLTRTEYANYRARGELTKVTDASAKSLDGYSNTASTAQHKVNAFATQAVYAVDDLQYFGEQGLRPLMNNFTAVMAQMGLWGAGIAVLGVGIYAAVRNWKDLTSAFRSDLIDNTSDATERLTKRIEELKKETKLTVSEVRELNAAEEELAAKKFADKTATAPTTANEQVKEAFEKAVKGGGAGEIQSVIQDAANADFLNNRRRRLQEAVQAGTLKDDKGREMAVDFGLYGQEGQEAYSQKIDAAYLGTAGRTRGQDLMRRIGEAGDPAALAELQQLLNRSGRYTVDSGGTVRGARGQVLRGASDLFENTPEQVGGRAHDEAVRELNEEHDKAADAARARADADIKARNAEGARNEGAMAQQREREHQQEVNKTAGLYRGTMGDSLSAEAARMVAGGMADADVRKSVAARAAAAMKAQGVAGDIAGEAAKALAGEVGDRLGASLAGMGGDRNQAATRLAVELDAKRRMAGMNRDVQVGRVDAIDANLEDSPLEKLMGRIAAKGDKQRLATNHGSLTNDFEQAGANHQEATTMARRAVKLIEKDGADINAAIRQAWGEMEARLGRQMNAQGRVAGKQEEAMFRQDARQAFMGRGASPWQATQMANKTLALVKNNMDVVDAMQTAWNDLERQIAGLRNQSRRQQFGVQNAMGRTNTNKRNQNSRMFHGGAMQ